MPEFKKGQVVRVTDAAEQRNMTEGDTAQVLQDSVEGDIYVEVLFLTGDMKGEQRTMFKRRFADEAAPLTCYFIIRDGHVVTSYLTEAEALKEVDGFLKVNPDRTYTIAKSIATANSVTTTTTEVQYHG